METKEINQWILITSIEEAIMVQEEEVDIVAVEAPLMMVIPTKDVREWINKITEENVIIEDVEVAVVEATEDSTNANVKSQNSTKNRQSLNLNLIVVVVVA